MSVTRIVKGMVQSDVRLVGKTVLITGANIGIGQETALDMARRGARVIMACRNVDKAEVAKAKILEEVKDADLVIKKLDLSSLASVRTCAKDVNENEQRLDILINNAGVMMCPPWKTEDGFEMQLGTNHIGHFLLTNLLLDLIKKSAPSRIVIVSSIAHRAGKMNWDDMMQEKNYNAVTAYGASKLANIHHCTELGRRLEGSGVTCYSLHPGTVKTNLQQHLGDISHLPFMWRALVKGVRPFANLTGLTPQQGAQTTIYCAIAPELSSVSGKYYKYCAEKTPSSGARKKEDAERLWKLSEEWTREKTAEGVTEAEDATKGETTAEVEGKVNKDPEEGGNEQEEKGDEKVVEAEEKDEVKVLKDEEAMYEASENKKQGDEN